jgi:putative FmdB family regulatory protein
MPTYRYRCGGCGEEFEVWQSITDDPFRTHDHGCGGELVKVLTPAGIVLKGSGFYRNDSRSGSGKRGGGDGSSGDGKGDKPEKADKADKSDKGGASKDGDASKSSSKGDGSSSSTASSSTS